MTEARGRYYGAHERYDARQRRPEERLMLAVLESGLSALGDTRYETLAGGPAPDQCGLCGRPWVAVSKRWLPRTANARW